MQKRIRVTVDSAGRVVIMPEGFKGAECQTATKALEQRLGVVTSESPTPDALEVETATDTIIDL